MATAISSCLPTKGLKSWQHAELAAGTLENWQSQVTKMRDEYERFFAGGIKCSCGTVLAQPTYTIKLGDWLKTQQRTKSAAPIEIDLTSDEPIVPLNERDACRSEIVHCPSCKSRCYCCACGIELSATEQSSHPESCIMRRVHAIAVAVERLRRAQAGLDQLPLSKTAAAGVGNAAAPVKKATGPPGSTAAFVPFMPVYYGEEDYSEYEEEDEEDEYYETYNTPIYQPFLTVPWSAPGTSQVPKARKGAVYGGGAQDNQVVKEAANRRRQNLDASYQSYAAILKQLCRAIPTTVYSSSGSRASMMIEVIDGGVEIVLDDDVRASNTIAFRRAELSRDFSSDLCSDHPLLLQMLLSPGIQHDTTEPAKGRTATKEKAAASKMPRPASVLFSLFADMFRSSVMEISKSKFYRDFFGESLQAVTAISGHRLLAQALLYTGGGDLAWTSCVDCIRLSAPPTVELPGACLFALLANLGRQADVFIKNSQKLSGNAEVLIGDTAEEEEFEAVITISKQLERAIALAREGIQGWAAREQCKLTLMDHGNTIGSPEKAPSAKRGRPTSSSGAKIVTTPARPSEADLISYAVAAAQSAGRDPVVAFECGFARVDYTPPAATVTAYETRMRDEAYNTMEDLKDMHHYKCNPTSSGASMKRHMRVSAEMANLPTLAVNFPSSILVRQDESSMDYLRALLTGPSDTPYMNGIFLFDIYLPPAYPQVSPNVLLLTTGGGFVRFNPNLYAEGKVCLSLLGTWSGPGWEPDVSTLSQVLISIQSQIMNDSPFYNEPSYESYLGTDNGKRHVAKHNAQIRLATIRYAMIEPLMKLPVGFEHAVKTHFYYKREEIKVQVAQWLAEVKAMAAYEHALLSPVEELRTKYTEDLKKAISTFPTPPAKAGAGKKRGRVASAGFDHVSYLNLPPGFVMPPDLRAIADKVQKLQAASHTWTAATGFECFPRGISHFPRASTAAYAPETRTPTSHSTGMQRNRLRDLAACTDAAAKELYLLLDKLEEPKELE